jgi:glycosyltransferase involved in cell wall biosynthesis
MKILMVNDYKAKIGGAEVYMYTLKKHLQAAGHEVRVFTTDISKADYIKRTTRVSAFTYLTRIFNVKSFFQARSLLQKFKPDSIHIHSYYELSPAFLFWTKDIPVVMTIHDQRIKSAVIDPPCTYAESHNGICPGCMECVGAKGTLFEKIKNFVYPFFTKKVKLYIAPSKFIQNQLKQFKDLKPVVQLYNGFELPSPKALPLKHTVLFAGRLSENKGAQYLVQAMPAVLKQFPNAHLAIAGSGNYESELKKLVEQLKLSEVVTMHGAVAHDGVLKLIYKADVVVVPSAYPDNLPTICLEAISAGRPVIASNIGGLPEIIQDGKNGYLVKPNSASAIADKICELFSKKNSLQDMSVEAIKRSKPFQIKSHLKAIISMYQHHVIR